MFASTWNVVLASEYFWSDKIVLKNIWLSSIDSIMPTISINSPFVTRIFSPLV